MTVSERPVRIATADRQELDAILASPARLPAPVVVLVPSIFGLNAEAHRWLGSYSAAGFFALLYDPFWRTEPGALSVTDDEDRARAQHRRDHFDVELGVRDLADIVRFARALPGCNGRVAVAGYCFGGRYAMIAAARLDVQAGISFHGIGMGRSLEDARKIKAPVSFHFGDADHSTPMEEVRELERAVAGNPLVELCVYPGAGHSFTWHGHKLYHAEADTLSWRRSLNLLESLF